ncbi:MAG: hypothetical protein KA974_07595 [Saprospiraceae bacterium]|nr:hypothetical protein [Saprospiraceae bacterium]MBP7679674.1 hypothetical protein [Saprospiraceae bacterium]
MKNSSKHPAPTIGFSQRTQTTHTPTSSTSPIEQKDTSLRGFLKNHICRKKVSPALIQSIKDKVRILPA